MAGRWLLVIKTVEDVVEEDEEDTSCHGNDRQRVKCKLHVVSVHVVITL